MTLKLPQKSNRAVGYLAGVYLALAALFVASVWVGLAALLLVAVAVTYEKET